jgi:hypothetical protein
VSAAFDRVCDRCLMYFLVFSFVVCYDCFYCYYYWALWGFISMYIILYLLILSLTELKIGSPAKGCMKHESVPKPLYIRK